MPPCCEVSVQRRRFDSTEPGGIMIDERIVYYTRGERDHNFGDYLTDFLARQALITPLVPADLYRLIGSAISAPLIRDDFARLGTKSLRIAYWGCGARDQEPLPPDLLEACELYGVRGPLSRDLLGLPSDTPLGDPGLLMPLLHSPRPSARTSGRVACMAHFYERDQVEALATAAGGAVTLSPAVSSDDELRVLIDDIASADFLLTGSLHGAIIAAAYGRPFAFWDTGFIDIPFKWRDFAASIGIEMPFCTTLEEGLSAYGAIAGDIRLPDLAPILGCCPFGVRPSLLIKALASDMQMPHEEARRWLDAAENLAQSRLSWGEAAREAAHRARAQRAENARRTRDQDANRAAALLAAAERDLEGVTSYIAQRRADLSVRISPQNAAFSLAAGTVGNRFLGEGWTQANEEAPWSLPPVARLRIPATTEWMKATGIALQGYIFSPRVEPFQGARLVTIWIGEVVVHQQRFFNPGPSHTANFAFQLSIPDHIRALGGDLVLSLSLETVGSNASYGFNDDDRPIGVAPTSLTFCFDEPPAN